MLSAIKHQNLTKSSSPKVNKQLYNLKLIDWSSLLSTTCCKGVKMTIKRSCSSSGYSSNMKRSLNSKWPRKRGKEGNLLKTSRTPIQCEVNKSQKTRWFLDRCWIWVYCSLIVHWVNLVRLTLKSLEKASLKKLNYRNCWQSVKTFQDWWLWLKKS